jgi:hypothetical protein
MKNLFIICALAIAPALFANERADVNVVFHNFPWGTSMEEFTARVGRPAHVEEYDGLQSLVYDNIIVSGYPAFMIVYFSENGLEGGTYYFHTFSFEELTKCYISVQNELLALYGSTTLSTTDGTFREMRPYETVWDLPGGYVYLKVNTRENEPVMLWYSSPALTSKIKGS